jgi:hypothetical protein
MGHDTNASSRSRKMKAAGLRRFRQVGTKVRQLNENEVTK